MDGPPGKVQAATFSTADYRDGEAAAAWREVFGRTLLRIDINPLTDRFRARARVIGWPGFGLVDASTTAVHQCNSRALIASDDVCFGGISSMPDPNQRWRAAQLGREADLPVGDGSLMSNGDVGSITLPRECRYTAFALPAALLKPLVPDMGAWFARRLPGTSAEMRMLSRYLRLAWDEAALATPVLRNAFVHHVVDLLALAIGATRDAAEIAKSRGGRAARLYAIKQDIQQAIGRTDLSVRLISAWHNVTPRYVQVLFEEDGTTFTRYVLDRRLDAALRLLADPARAQVPISAVAYECGFADLSNFNRVFRRRFHCAPRDVRNGRRGPKRNRALSLR